MELKTFFSAKVILEFLKNKAPNVEHSLFISFHYILFFKLKQYKCCFSVFHQECTALENKTECLRKQEAKEPHPKIMFFHCILKFSFTLLSQPFFFSVSVLIFFKFNLSNSGI